MNVPLNTIIKFGLLSLTLALATVASAEGNRAVPVCISGVHPHLAYFNEGQECGTGAVVPWAGRLWVITYPPHAPNGSDDKLYEIDEDLNVAIRPESVGGTHANRMIHRESEQLFIGPYAIDHETNVRAISPRSMSGRLTGTARHLFDPANKVYFATMEEGFYEVDVHSLKVKELYPDGNQRSDVAGILLPGYHGKGLYSGQGRLVYANNGEWGDEARRNPSVASGCLAEWNGEDWKAVRRNQFTEVSGPGGISGSERPETDPIWSIGWDHRSLILMMRDDGAWHTYRLPKASHAYDGAHGWNTEWPRIRDIGEDDLLMTMHGMFWRFPRTFSAGNTAGIAPRSSYLKVIGDFCRWNDHVVLGCDDAAKSEFLNKRRAKGEIAGPGQSHSNLRFIRPEQLDQFGPTIGRGAVWLEDAVRAGEPSDAFLFAGFDRRGLHLAHDNDQPVEFSIEVDDEGNGDWRILQASTVPSRGYKWLAFLPGEAGAWIRLKTDRDCQSATAFFQYADTDARSRQADPIFDGLAIPGDPKVSGGLVRVRGDNKRTLHFAALRTADGLVTDTGYYEMNVDLQLRPVDDPKTHAWLKENVAVPKDVISVDAASVLYVDDAGNRYRLPKGDAAFDSPGPLGPERIDREVCTERDLFNCHGTFYELPAENAGGFAKIRPIATHNRRITDYCSWRGLLALTGVSDDAPTDNPHIIRSEDGRCALWVGEVDDLWKLGKPVGQGGPWKDARVKAGVPSDPYLMTGYDKKRLELSHDAAETVRFTLGVDFSGTGWHTYETFEVPQGESLRYVFPKTFYAYWVRVRSDTTCAATAWFTYE